MFSGKYRLAVKHLAAILLVSIFFATIILLFQSYMYYVQEIEARNQTLKSIETSYLAPSAAAVFFFDHNQLELLAEGMLQLPHIDAVTIAEHIAGEYHTLIKKSTGELKQDSFEFPLVYQYEDDDRYIGTIIVSAGVRHMWPRVLRTIGYTAVFTMVMMFGMAAMIFGIAHRMIFRHLTEITDYAHSISPHNLHQKRLSLQRQSSLRGDELDVIVHAINTMLDRLKEELLTSAELNTLLNAIIDSPQDIRVFALDSNYRYLSYTSSHQVDMSQIWNASIEKGSSMLMYISDDTKRSHFQENFQRCLSGECFTEEEEMLRTDATSSLYEHRYNPLYSHDGRIIGATVFSIDITQRKQAEKALRTSEEKYRTLFETMSPGVIYQNAHGHITSANPAAEQLLGISAEEMKGKSSDDSRWHMITDNGDPVPKAEHPAMQALKTGIKHGPELRGIYIPERETYIWLQITATPLFMSDERQPFQVYTTIDDVTTLKQTEDTLAQQLREKEQLIQELFHRTNNNMQVMQGLLSYHESVHPEQAFFLVAEKLTQQIQSMAMAHQQLYQYNNLSRVPLREYLISLVDNVMANSSTEDMNLHGLYEIEDIPILLDTGVPLGLAFTLLMQDLRTHVLNQSTNIDTHQLRISAQEKASGDIEILISSKYMPTGITSASETASPEFELAISIIESQLNGTIAFPDKDEGVCIIRFSDNRYYERVRI